MRFGRVEGVILVDAGADGAARLRLVVSLETGGRIETVRDEEVAPLRPLLGPDDLLWHADQYTQETLGTDLAEAGWEVIGAGDPPAPEAGALPRSAAYAVRNLNPVPPFREEREESGPTGSRESG
jgi:hypothetical protein